MAVQEKKVPQLRFKEFSGEWEEKRFFDITDKISDGIHSTPKYDENGLYFFINGNNLINGKIKFSDKTKRISKIEYKKHQRELNENTILLSINGTIGNLAFYENENVVLGKSACYINLKKGLPKYFYYSILQTSTIINFYNSELTGSTIKNLSLKTIKETNLFIPQLPEQQKIATFLTAVDKKIALLQQKKTALEQYKKGVMQQLFPSTGSGQAPQLRFKPALSEAEGDDDGNAYSDWEEKRLGEVSNIIMGQSPNSSSYNTDRVGKYLVQGNADISDRRTNPRNWTSQPTKLCEIGDLILTVRAPVGAIAKSNHNACIGRGVCAIKNKSITNIEFLYQFLLDYEDKWKGLEQGSTFTAVSGKDIKSIKINLPSIEEQTKIANCLSAIDAKIALVDKQLSQTQAFKKGLLQQLFV